jgi:hypothetical protein
MKQFRMRIYHWLGVVAACMHPVFLLNFLTACFNSLRIVKIWVLVLRGLLNSSFKGGILGDLSGLKLLSTIPLQV